MTVIIGANCSDGIGLIADRKITDAIGKTIGFREKKFGDLGHILTGYAGNVGIFDIFRKYMVGDIVINRDNNDPYTFDNFISKTSSSVKGFNMLRGDPLSIFEVLVEKHQWKNSKLHYIDFKGKSLQFTYRSIGSGAETADMFCKTLEFNKITMKEFMKHAFLAILYMDQYCPGLRVGIEAGGIPDMKYLAYDREWDIRPPLKDITEFKEYAKTRMLDFDKTFRKIGYVK